MLPGSTGGDLRRAAEISARYPEHQLGLTDTTLLAVAERLHGTPVVMLDRGHFSLFRDRKGKPLQLLP